MHPLSNTEQPKASTIHASSFRADIEAPSAITHLNPQLAVILGNRHSRLFDPTVFRDIDQQFTGRLEQHQGVLTREFRFISLRDFDGDGELMPLHLLGQPAKRGQDRKSTRLNSSHLGISYAVFCLKKKKKENTKIHTINT